MASKKGIKAKAPGAIARRSISVPAGTREILLHIQVGKPPKGGKKTMLKSSKSPIDEDPMGGGG